MEKTVLEGRAEVIVIGGGVIGLSIACELLSRGHEVLVLERGRPGCGATDAAGGMLAPVSEAEIESPELLAFALDSLERYPRFVEEVERRSGASCHYRTDGTLWVATNRDDQEELDRLVETLELKQLRNRPLSSGEVADREPHLSGRVLAGLLVESDLQVDPRALSRCLVRTIHALGGRLLCQAGVSEVLAHDGTARGVRGKTSDGGRFRFDAKQIVLAAGAWSERGIELPLERLGLRPVKGQLIRLRGPSLLRHVVRTPDVYLVPREDGELLVGATMEEMGFESGATAGGTMDLLRHAWELLPGIYDLDLAELSVGLRPAFEDHLPRIGPSEIHGLFLALGHYRQGVLLAPATAHYLATWMSEGRAPSELARFTPGGRPAAGRRSEIR